MKKGMSDEDGSIYDGKALWAEDRWRRQFLLRRLCPSDAIAELWLALVGHVVIRHPRVVRFRSKQRCWKEFRC